MDERTKSDLIQQLKMEMNGGKKKEEPEKTHYIRERNAIESAEYRRRRETVDPEEERIKAIKKEQQKKEAEEELFQMLRDQRRNK